MGLTDRQRALLQDLNDVLSKHDAAIEFGLDDCSDTHGIHGERMLIMQKQPGTSCTYDTVATITGWSIEKFDLDQHMG